MILFPQRIDKDIAEDDPVRLLDALVDNLMLDNVYKLYKPSGRKPYHPQMMLKVILYAYMNNRNKQEESKGYIVKSRLR